MKMFHAGLYPQVVKKYHEIRPESKIRALISLPYIEGGIVEMLKLRHRENPVLSDIMIDTGTFGQNVINNKPLMTSRFNEYCQYVRLFGHEFDLVPAYDEDFDDAETNQALLEQMRVKLMEPSDPLDEVLDRQRVELAQKLIPTVHSKDGAFEEFKYYHEMGCNYIAIGSKPRPKAEEWQKIQKYRYEHGVKIHLFGVMDVGIIKDVMPDSVDSTDFAISTSYGDVVMLYWNTDDSENPFKQEITFPDKKVNKPKADIFNDEKHGTYLRAAGFDFSYGELLASSEKRQLVNLYCIEQMEKSFTEYLEPRHRAKYMSSQSSSDNPQDATDNNN